MKIINVAVVVAALCIGGAAQAQSTTGTQSSAMVYGGFSSPTDGYEDRYFEGVMVDKYLDNGIGVHFDAAAVQREQDGVYAAIGASYAVADGVRVKGVFGGSTENRNILPQYYGYGQVQVQSGKSVVTPSFAYRHFRTGMSEYQPAIDVAHYFSIPGDRGGYYALQTRAAYAIHPGRNAPSFGAGLTTVRNGGLSLGIYAEGGRLAYANLVDIGAPGVDSPFWSVRPSVGYRLNRTIEIVARGEYSHNDFFSTRGVLIGIKARLD
jgi:hypothetical protein